MRHPEQRGRQRLASRGVQAAFLIVLVALWYLATSRWHVSPILLPNPQIQKWKFVNCLHAS